MDLEDLFEGKRHHQRRHGGDRGHEDRHGHGGHDGHDEHGSHGHRASDDAHRYRYDRHSSGHPDLQRYLPLLSANKGLFLIGGLLLVVLAVGLLVVALPLLGKVLGVVDQNGLKGIVERLWLGSGGR